jgi:hypothetical protein
MAKELSLPEPWAGRGWKAKIRESEGPEEPHVTILFRTFAWRFSIRNWRHLDREPPTRDVPQEVLDFVQRNLPTLIEWWDLKYPENPVRSSEEVPPEVSKKARRKQDK